MSFIMNQNDKNKLEKFGMTHNQIRELKSLYVERYVDNMSTKDLVAYVTDDLDQYYHAMGDTEFIDEAQNYWEDSYDEVVKEVKEYADPEDELIEKITDKTGWCIKSIKYCENRPHRLTSFK